MTIRKQLEHRVGEVVRREIAELPPDLRTLAERVPVFEEVRITYIHEFGHYLGLGESELETRGLL